MAELTWQGQADWDAAQDQYRVAANGLGPFDPDTLRIGFDPDYSPLADAEHYWPLSSTSDTTDVAGGHSVTIHGTQPTSGVFGTDALSFEYENQDWVEVGTPSGFDHGDDMTVMAHISPPDPPLSEPQYSYIMGFAQGDVSDTQSGNWILHIDELRDDDDEWRMAWAYHDGTDWQPSGEHLSFHRRELDPYEDYILVATFDFTDNHAEMTLNGIHDAKQFDNNSRDKPTGAASAIGDRNPDSGNYWTGTISNVAYWSRSLTRDERTALTTLNDGGSLITATKSDSDAAVELTTNAAVGAQRQIDVAIHQDVDGDGEPENSQTVAIDNGENTYDLAGFDEVDGADYWLEIQLDTESMAQTPELYSASVTTGTADDPLLPVDDRLEWNRQADWDRAQDRARVVTREFGSRDPHNIELGHDPEYPPYDDAAFYAPLDETTSRVAPIDVVSGETGSFGGGPALSVDGGTGSTGMFVGGSSNPGYATWENMDVFQHEGARTIAALINAEDLSGTDDRGVIIGAGVGADGAEWTLEIRDGRRLVFRYTSGIPWWHSDWEPKQKETVIRTFHRDFTDGHHMVVFVFDQSQDETEVRGGKYWTIIESANLSISLSGEDIEIESSDIRVPGRRRRRHHRHGRHGNHHSSRRKFKMPRYKWWRGRRRKVAALGLCFLDKILDVKKLVLPLPEPDSPPTVRIGRHPTQETCDYHGVVDEVLYWDRALGEEEVNQIRRTYSDGHLTTASETSFGEAFEVVTDVSRPALTTIELTIHQDTSGNGESNRSQTVTVPDGETTIALNAFEAVDGSDYWLEWELTTREKTQTPTIHSAYLNLTGVTGSVIETDQNGVITTDEFGSIDTVE